MVSTEAKATKSKNTNSRRLIAEKVNLAVKEFKNGSSEKKYEKSLKRASKILNKVLAMPINSAKLTGKKAAKKSVFAAS